MYSARDQDYNKKITLRMCTKAELYPESFITEDHKLR